MHADLHSAQEFAFHMNSNFSDFYVNSVPILGLTFIGAMYLVFGLLFVFFIFDIFLFGTVFINLLAFIFLIVGFGIAPYRFKAVVFCKEKTAQSFDFFILLVSIIAVFSLFFDRYYLRGIDYFALGMAGARAKINSMPASGSFFSMFGNFFSYGFFIPFINLMYEWESRDRIARFFLLVGSFFVVFFLCYLTGGRTVVLIFLAVLFSCLVGRRINGLPCLPHKVGLVKSVAFLSLAFFFLGFVFYVRAKTFGGGDSSLYVDSVCYHLTSVVNDNYLNCRVGVSGSLIDDVLNYGKAVMLYGYHVLWITENIINEGFSSGSILFDGFANLVLNRFGLTVHAHAYPGFFVPAGAALFHDTGILGVVCFFLFLGFFLRFSFFRYRNGYLWSGRFCFTILYAGCLLSLLIPPTNLPGFILSVACMIIYWLIWELLKIVNFVSSYSR